MDELIAIMWKAEIKKHWLEDRYAEYMHALTYPERYLTARKKRKLTTISGA